MEVTSEVSFRNRNCHDSPQRKLKGTDSPVSPSTVAQERPSVPQVGAHLGRRAVLGLKNTVTSHYVCVETGEPSGMLHYSFSEPVLVIEDISQCYYPISERCRCLNEGASKTVCQSQ